MIRIGRGHNLNMRAAVINLCEQKGISDKDYNIISVHLGGGISVGMFDHGRIIDMISDDEGPFSPERSWGLPDLPCRGLLLGMFIQATRKA